MIRGIEGGSGEMRATCHIAEAVSKARELAKAVGCRLMYVNALNDGLAAWYRRQGFLSLPSKPNSLVLDLRAK